MSDKRALITGITGQDGSYLAEYLLNRDYEVHGLRRRNSVGGIERIEHLYKDPHDGGRGLTLHYGDVTDFSNLLRVVNDVQPTEIYNLAAQSHVRVSFETPEYTANTDGLGTLRLLDAVRSCGIVARTRIYQASSSEIFGKVQEVPQSENTPFYPRSPYGAAKLYAYWIAVNYREAYGMHVSNGILFNHESPRRGSTFVSRKITKAVAAILNGKQDRLYLGNLDARRDWGYAPEYVEAMWLMLQQEAPDDFVIATGETHSVREFATAAFSYAGIEIEWEGSGEEEVGRDQTTGAVLVAIDPWYYRPTEVDLLIGDPTKAREQFGWMATTKFDDLVRIMMDADLHGYMVEAGEATANQRDVAGPSLR